MKVLYTFVLDAHPKFIVQGRLFLANLLAAGVSPDSIVANITPSCGALGYDLASSFKIGAVDLQPQLDGKFCNKIDQLTLHNRPHFDILAVCDTDLAITRRLDNIASLTHIRAKRVDSPNPPLHILDDFHRFFDIKVSPEIVPTTCEPASLTYRMNCNGGLILIPRQYVEPLGREWRRFAEHVYLERHRLLRWIDHVDQVSWAFAVLHLQLPFEELPVEYNFPSVIAKKIPDGTYKRPIVLHHHNDLDLDGRIRLTGITEVDRTIAYANACRDFFAAEGAAGVRPAGLWHLARALRRMLTAQPATLLRLFRYSLPFASRRSVNPSPASIP
jgi:hypothetical protein